MHIRVSKGSIHIILVVNRNSYTILENVLEMRKVLLLQFYHIQNTITYYIDKIIMSHMAVSQLLYDRANITAGHILLDQGLQVAQG